MPVHDQSNEQDFRPYGELVMEVVQPIHRFGHALLIGVRESNGVVWQAVAKEDGTFKWRKVDANNVGNPTLYLDDEMVALLYKALTGQPVRARGQAVQDHLTDAIAVRDRALTLVEQAWQAVVVDMTVTQGVRTK